MSKFTSGPWYLTNLDGTDYTVIRTKNYKEVLGVSEWIRIKKEDICLMVIAPEMHEALELCLSELSQYGYANNPSGPMERGRLKAIKVAIKVLAKAKGK